MTVSRFCGRGMLLCVLTALAACGGGGSSSQSGGGGNGGGGGGGGTGNNRGDFTISTSSVSFSGKAHATQPITQTLTVHLTDTAAADVGAGYRPGVTPATWLTATGSGSGANYTFTLSANASGLAAGTYTVTLTFGTADASGNILQTHDVAVTLALHDGLALVSGPVAASATAGSSVQSSQQLPFTLTAPDTLQWTAASNASWLVAPGGTQHGGGTFNVTVNTAGLTSGSYVGQVTLTNAADPSDTVTVGVTLGLAKPVFDLSGQSITLGGPAGVDPSPVSLSFSLNTGQNAYPVTVVPDSAGGWLEVSGAGATVSGAGASATVDVDRSKLPQEGEYQGNLSLQAIVNGETVTAVVPVTAYYDRNQLVVSALGVAFSAFPGHQVLARTLTVRDTYGLSGVNWTAQADTGQTWLTATPSGVTGDPLTLTADPSGLSAGQYTAHVTVTSSDAGVVNQQVVYVGLTVGSSDPVQVDFAAVTAAAVVTNPVEPWVYVLNAGTLQNSIDVYDTNTGSKLRTFTGTFTSASALAVSDDGNTLYVLEPANATNSNGDIRVLSAFDGSYQQQTYPLQGGRLDPATEASLQYARPDGHPVVISPATGDAFDTNGNHMALQGNGLIGAVQTTISSDQQMLFTQNTGLTPATVASFHLDYSNSNPGRLLVTAVASNNGASDNRGNGHDVAISPDGTRLFVAAGSPYRFDILDPHTLAWTGSLAGDPFPNNVEQCWNGMLAGGADDSSNASGDIWVYDSSGTLHTQLDSGTDALFAHRLSFSGDCTRIVTGSGSGLRIQSVP